MLDAQGGVALHSGDDGHGITRGPLGDSGVKALLIDAMVIGDAGSGERAGQCQSGADLPAGGDVWELHDVVFSVPWMLVVIVVPGTAGGSLLALALTPIPIAMIPAKTAPRPIP